MHSREDKHAQLIDKFKKIQANVELIDEQMNLVSPKYFAVLTLYKEILEEIGQFKVDEASELGRAFVATVQSYEDQIKNKCNGIIQILELMKLREDQVKGQQLAHLYAEWKKQAMHYYNIGNKFLKQHEFSEAADHYLLAIEMLIRMKHVVDNPHNHLSNAERLEVMIDLRAVIHALIKIYKTQGNMQEAAFYEDLLQQADQSLE